MAPPQPTVPPPGPSDLSSSLKRNIEALTERRRQEAASASRQEKVALAITSFAGSMVFAYIHLAVYGMWVLVNLGVIPGWANFDPSFGRLGTEASVEAIFLATFVLISQNRASAAADKRADLDLHISLLTEHELTKVAELLAKVATRLDISPASDPELTEIQRDVAPEAVLDELESKQTQP